MKRRISKLAMVLTFLILLPSLGAQALAPIDVDLPPNDISDQPPHVRLIPPVSVQGGGVFPTYTGCGGVEAIPPSNESYEQELIRLVNTFRSENGLPPLKRVHPLDEAARYHARDMAQDDYFEHDSYDRSGGELVRACAWDARISSYYSNWRWIAENIAAGYTTPESVMDGWIGSSGHRDNLLSPDAWEIGVGYYAGGSWGHYWVQDLGRRSGVYPLVINDDDASTDIRDVSLYIYGDWEEMRLRNDDGSWTDWQPFQARSAWELPGDGGEHTVWAELRTGSSTAVTSDAIVLTQSFIPALGGVPETLSFTYSIPDRAFIPSHRQITLQNTGTDDPIAWEVTAEGDWLTATPCDGTTPASVLLTPTDTGVNLSTDRTDAVTVTVTNPTDVRNAPQSINVTLQVTDRPLSRIYLPLAMSNCGPSSPSLSHHPNDAYYDEQWALQKINASEAWTISTGEETLVAVLDTGADLDHPDLTDKVRTDIDQDFVNGDDSANDDHGHGTHVCGIAAATTDNEDGVAGLGWNATILPLKVLDAGGAGSASGLAEAIRYAADHDADVINMSLGGAAPCVSYLQEAVNYAHAQGVLVVAASGNHDTDSSNAEVFPANCEHVLGVAATNASDTVASYSNYGAHVSIAAPGSGIYSTGWEHHAYCDSGYCNMSGTSMAAPHVAGLAALLRAQYPSYTPGQIASAMLDNAKDLGAAGWDAYYGCGRINASRALSEGALGEEPTCLEVGTWSAGADSTAADTPPAHVPGEILFTTRSGISAQTIASQHRATAEFLPSLQVWRLRAPHDQEQSILDDLRDDPNVVHAELDYLVYAQ